MSLKVPWTLKLPSCKPQQPQEPSAYALLPRPLLDPAHLPRYDGANLRCDYGYWNSGEDKDPCTFCGEAYNTSDNGNTTQAVTGAAGPESCILAAGWTVDADTGGIKPCSQGW